MAMVSKLPIPLRLELRDERASPPRASPGDWIKVGLMQERFWCRVMTVQEDGVQIVATVENDLVSCPLRFRDQLLELYERNVLVLRWWGL